MAIQSTPTDDLEIQGHCDDTFAKVRDEFERNFTERGDIGASVCIYVEGEEVANLWGGLADPESETPWKEDTVTVIMSATKGATALCAHILADRGELEFDAPVAEYWPEFAAHGKETILVRMLLNHQAGLPAVRTPVPPRGSYDWELMVNSLADETPFWEPGTRFGYHPATFGWLVGEVIRRISGKSLGTFFRDEVAGRLGLDFWIGTPVSELPRVTPLRPDPADPVHEALAADSDSNSLLHLGFNNSGGYTSPGGWNNAMAYQAELGASGGITNGRSLARMYAPLSLGGTFGGYELVSPETVRRMGSVESSGSADATIGMPFRIALGYMKGPADLGLPESSFSHGGWGGSMGFADPDTQVAFGYVMSQMSSTPRWQSLAKAAYRSLGYREGKFGIFMR